MTYLESISLSQSADTGLGRRGGLVRGKDSENKLFSELDPLDHLRHILRLCYVHFKCNVLELRGYVPQDVYEAMLSLAMAEALPNLPAVLQKIRSGGKKAIGMLSSISQLLGITSLSYNN